MAVTRNVAVVEDTRYRDHPAPAGHPERPERLVAVGEALRLHEAGLLRLDPRPASDEELLRVHAAPHLRGVADAARRGPGRLDADTFISETSSDVARLAAGASVDLCLAVARGELGTGLAAIRPPGHHAEAGRAMGFCLYNNVAVAARALQAELQLSKVLILDFDVHHGNGSQHSFEDDPGVLYFSTHQFPFYPGTGDFGEVGVGRGAGTTLNVPLPEGCGDLEYLGVLRRVLVPAALAYRPEIILVSCGFDAHRDDPLASMEVSRAGYLAMTRCVRAVADEVCGGRLVFLLEGGYSLSGLREGTDAVLEALLEPDPVLPAAPELVPGGVLHSVVGRVATIHAGRYPGLGAS